MSDSEATWPRGVLQKLGIAVNAENVWRLLIAHATIDIEQLAAECSLSKEAVRDAIDQLIAARLVRTNDCPAGVTAIDPTVALESQIARAERQLLEQAEEFAELRTLIPEIAGDFRRGHRSTGSQPGVEIIVDTDQVRRQIYLATEGCRAEARSLDHGSTIDGLQDSQPSDIAIVGRGVRCRTIVGAEALRDPAVYEIMQRQHTLGESYRALAATPTRMLVLDSALAVVAVDPADMDGGAMFVRVPTLIDLLVRLFDHLWSVADPIFSTSGALEAPTGRVARSLELMAIGNTDQRIARTLGVGTRTVRRDIAELKALLGVSSRAEMAAAAIRKGWL